MRCTGSTVPPKRSVAAADLGKSAPCPSYQASDNKAKQQVIINTKVPNIIFVFLDTQFEKAFNF